MTYSYRPRRHPLFQPHRSIHKQQEQQIHLRRRRLPIRSQLAPFSQELSRLVLMLFKAVMRRPSRPRQQQNSKHSSRLMKRNSRTFLVCLMSHSKIHPQIDSRAKHLKNKRKTLQSYTTISPFLRFPFNEQSFIRCLTRFQLSFHHLLCRMA